MKLSYILTFFIVLTLAACQMDGKRNIKSYYFPVKELRSPKVYEYRPVGNDSLSYDYWYYSTIVKEGQIFFTGNYYDDEFIVKQFFREEMVDNGMLLNDMYLYATKDDGKQVQVPVEILSDNSFPFRVSDPSGIFLYKVKWIVQQEPLTTATLIRNRRYIGDTSYVYQGRALDCIYFELREVVEGYQEEEGYIEPELSGIEIYAKDLGLVYYKKELNGNTSLAYELADIYDMKQLEEKARAVHNK